MFQVLIKLYDQKVGSSSEKARQKNKKARLAVGHGRAARVAEFVNDLPRLVAAEERVVGLCTVRGRGKVGVGVRVRVRLGVGVGVGVGVESVWCTRRAARGRAPRSSSSSSA